MELLKLLKERNDLTLLTNSAEAFHELAQSEINVVSTGGELNKIRCRCREESLRKLSVVITLILW